MTTPKYKLLDMLGVTALSIAITPMLVIPVALFYIPLSLLTAWIRVELWDWFVVPYLHLPHIPVWGMFGIAIFAHTFQRNSGGAQLEDSKDGGQEGKKQKWWMPFAERTLRAIHELAALGVGYCVHVYLLK